MDEFAMIELVKAEWNRARDARSEALEACLANRSAIHAYNESAAVENALWELWGKMVKAVNESSHKRVEELGV